MFWKMKDELFNGMLSVFSIADDILITGFYELGRDHNATLHKVQRICRQEILKLNQKKCPFRCTNMSFFSEVISWQGVSPDPRKWVY